MSIPSGFDYLENFDRTIIQQPLFATNYNFIGKALPGYEKETVVVSNKVGKALAIAQKLANKHDLSLKVFDSYRPLRAVEYFVSWANDIEDQLMKTEFYAHIDKRDIFKLGFVLLRSFHCTGAAVDLTLSPLGAEPEEKFIPGTKLFDGSLPVGERRSENSLDMGTAIDTFHERSHTNSPNVNEKAKKNRKLLCSIMQEAGFENYEKEWWHFNIVDKPFKDTYFDFVIS